MNKKYIIILIIILVLLGLGGWYLYSQKQPMNPSVVSDDNDQSAIDNLPADPSADPSAGEAGEADKAGQQSEINTDDWLTYRNEEYGFEVKYPSNMRIDNYNHDIRPSIIFMNKDKKNNWYFEIDIYKNFKRDLSSYALLDFEATGYTKLAGQKANIYEVPTGYCDGHGCGYPFIAYATKKDEDIISLIFFSDVDLNEQENYILSTFHFLN
ncbi:MAG: hypothetical protein Q8Q23_05725 [bacterium]|nr:hypothetical protein [bacterium]